MALDIGAGLLESGAEASRAWESSERVAMALGAERCEVFVIISFVLLTYTDRAGRSVTRSKKIRGGGTDYGRLERLNALSREICRRRPPLGEVRRLFREANETKKEKALPGYLRSMAVAVCFSLYFGGGIREAIASAISANTIQFMMTRVKGRIANKVLFESLTCFIAGAFSYLLVKIGVAGDYDAVAIGNIMLMVPGLSLVSAARDMIVGDLLCGILRFFETVLSALAIAVGFSLPLFLL